MGQSCAVVRFGVSQRDRDGARSHVVVLCRIILMSFLERVDPGCVNSLQCPAAYGKISKNSAWGGRNHCQLKTYLMKSSITALFGRGECPRFVWVGSSLHFDELLMPLLLLLLSRSWVFLGHTRSTFLSTRVNVHFCYFILAHCSDCIGGWLEGKRYVSLMIDDTWIMMHPTCSLQFHPSSTSNLQVGYNINSESSHSMLIFA